MKIKKVKKQLKIKNVKLKISDKKLTVCIRVVKFNITNFYTQIFFFLI